MKLNLEKQKYKRLENKLKRLYKNKQLCDENFEPKTFTEIQKTEIKCKK